MPIAPIFDQGLWDRFKNTEPSHGIEPWFNYPGGYDAWMKKNTNQAPNDPSVPPEVPKQQTPNQTDIWQDTWQPTGQINNGNPYSEAWKNISPNIGTKESTPSNTTVNTTNPVSGQGNFPKLPNITQDVMKELDSLNGVNTWGNFKTTGLGNQANPNYTESKGYYVNPYTGEYSF